ncbi:MAG TPA: DUF2510 domain-containing protein [Acidimicrobiales bacterium]|nr:DUF2510 domain-containing protein [Acidimicrobiales bacterium]
MSTTETSNAPLPAAWYRDPSGRHERRWWDGRAWTDRVADGEVVSQDAPIRSQPEAAVVAPVEPEPDPEPAPQQPIFDPTALHGATFESFDDEGGANEPEPEPEEFESFDAVGRNKVPIAERATTAPQAGRTLTLRAGGVVAGVLAIVAVCLWWGLTNRATAAEWRDRGEELQTELETVASNADALEQALARSANRGSQLEDGRQAFAELEEGVVATIDQIQSCVNDVNDILSAVALNNDPSSEIEQANSSCSQASVNAGTLRQLLSAVTGS